MARCFSTVSLPSFFVRSLFLPHFFHGTSYPTRCFINENEGATYIFFDLPILTLPVHRDSLLFSLLPSSSVSFHFVSALPSATGTSIFHDIHAGNPSRSKRSYSFFYLSSTSSLRSSFCPLFLSLLLTHSLFLFLFFHSSVASSPFPPSLPQLLEVVILLFA